MTKDDATTTPMIELAEMLVDNVEEFADRDAVEIAETWDRCDLIDELECNDLLDEED